ncbi:hypothetical protein XFF4834R_chr23670 [Xanthomonas citri pv. fuscans]|nr:hypothetical protein XFF4834R_chr23670 [Xanthomonas citri pv. fuscans]
MCASTRYWCLSAGSRVADLLTHGKNWRAAARQSPWQPNLSAARFDVRIDPLLVLERGK